MSALYHGAAARAGRGLKIFAHMLQPAVGRRSSPRTPASLVLRLRKKADNQFQIEHGGGLCFAQDGGVALSRCFLHVSLPAPRWPKSQRLTAGLT
jgi:hypothetical protein